jgi:D-serine deaminase-like pyridoxal phosphate-dependent protein
LEPVSHSEEHLVVKSKNGETLKVGDVLYGIPYHICPTTALYDEVHVIKDNQLLTTWKVMARGRKITI